MTKGPKFARKFGESGWPVAVVGVYFILRLGLFLSFPVVTNQDTWGFVAPNDDVQEILEGKSVRPGFVYQLLLRVFPIDSDFVYTNENPAIALIYDGVPAVAVITMLVSVFAWLCLAFSAARLFDPLRQKRNARIAISILGFSFVPAVWVWDHIVVAETLSISFTALWMAAALRVLTDERAVSWSFLLTMVFMFLSFGVRPSNAAVMLGFGAYLFVIYLPTVLKSLKSFAWWSMSVPVFALVAVRTFQISERWTGIWGPVVDANRSTSFLILPSFLKIFEEQNGISVCSDAVEYSRSMWREENLGSWGGVTQFSEYQSSEGLCVGDWNKLGELGPSYIEVLTNPSIQLDWWVTIFPVILNPLPGPALAEIIGISPFLALLTSILVGWGIFSILLWFGIGAMLGSRAGSGRGLLGLVILALGNLGGVWVLASLDGGAADRHAAPYNLLFFVTMMLLGAAVFQYWKARIREKLESTTLSRKLMKVSKRDVV